jgi:hypothetical protein
MSTPAHQAQERRTRCRDDALAYLAQRPRLSYAPATIRHRLRDDLQTDYAEEEIDDALAFLVAAGEARLERQAQHGVTRYYQATAAGILAYERSL